jgi:hypothetical protein
MAINLSVQAPVDRIERWRTNTRWGNLKPSTLADVLARSSKGDVADLVDLSEYAIGSDPRLTSWYDSRITRVLQADFGVKPSPFGDPKIAKMAADLVNECIARIPDWHQVQRDLLHAIAVGHALGENEWAYDETLDLNYVTRIDFATTRCGNCACTTRGRSTQSAACTARRWSITSGPCTSTACRLGIQASAGSCGRACGRGCSDA